MKQKNDDILTLIKNDDILRENDRGYILLFKFEVLSY